MSILHGVLRRRCETLASIFFYNYDCKIMKFTQFKDQFIAYLMMFSFDFYNIKLSWYWLMKYVNFAWGLMAALYNFNVNFLLNLRL